jgi:NADH-quinone oxidoreductase subunit E
MIETTKTQEQKEDAIDMVLVDQIIDPYAEDPTSLIGLLQDVQNEFNYLPKQALERIAERLDIPLADLYGVATFYKAFSLKPKGKHRICVCTGTACHVKGAQELLDRLLRELKIAEGETTDDGFFSVEEVRCVGACGLSPIVAIGEQRYGRLNQSKLLKLIDKYRKGGEVGGVTDEE